MFRSLAVLGMVVLATGVVALAALSKNQPQELPPSKDNDEKPETLSVVKARRIPSSLYYAPFSVN
jgi:hypothetical protein